MTNTKRGPGQPPIGTQVKGVLPDADLAQIGAMIEAGEYKTRSEAVRGLIGEALSLRAASSAWVEQVSPERTVRVARYAVEGELRVIDADRGLVTIDGVRVPEVDLGELMPHLVTGAPPALVDKIRVRAEWLTHDGVTTWVRPHIPLDGRRTSHLLPVDEDTPRSPLAWASYHRDYETSERLWITTTIAHTEETHDEDLAYGIPGAIGDRADLTRALARGGMAQVGPWERIGDWLRVRVAPLEPWEHLAELGCLHGIPHSW